MSYIYSFQNLRDEAAKLPIRILGIGVEYNLSSTVLLYFWEE